MKYLFSVLFCLDLYYTLILLVFNFEKAGLRLICEKHVYFFFNPIFFRPKNGTHEALEEYKKAEKIGEEQGDCWSFYPECPISIFNVIPDVYTTDDQVEVSFDGFDSGSKFDASNDTSEVRILMKSGLECFVLKFSKPIQSCCYRNKKICSESLNWPDRFAGISEGVP